jgi:hypothetical protein
MTIPSRPTLDASPGKSDESPLREMQHAARPDCQAEGWHLCRPTESGEAVTTPVSPAINQKPQYASVDVLLAYCRSLDDCIAATFDRVWTTEDGHLHAECCGQEVTYSYGIFGPDQARCKACGSAMVNVLSPHVSPVLLAPAGNYTHFPSEKFAKEMEGRNWLSWRKKGAS